MAGNGKGSFEWRNAEHTTARLIISQGYKPAGEKIAKKKTYHVSNPNATERAKTQEVEHARALFVADVTRGVHIDPGKFTVKDLYEYWLEHHVDADTAPKTAYRYKEMFTGRILPALGHLKANQVTVADCNALFRKLLKGDAKHRPLAAMTVNHYRRALSAMYRKCIRWQLIDRNPCEHAEAPRVERREMDFYDGAELGIILTAIKDDPISERALVCFAFTTGAREGEIAGLKWSDIDLDEPSMKISRSAQYLPGRGVYLKATKNKSSVRTVQLNQKTAELLKEHRVWQDSQRRALGKEWQNTDTVFATWNGGVDYPAHLGRIFKRVAERHGFRKIRFHDLRHTAASYMIGTGTDIVTVKKLLGHARASTTADMYGHSSQTAERRAVEAFDALHGADHGD
jgi:integrase